MDPGAYGLYLNAAVVGGFGGVDEVVDAAGCDDFCSLQLLASIIRKSPAVGGSGIVGTKVLVCKRCTKRWSSQLCGRYQRVEDDADHELVVFFALGVAA